MVQFICPNGHPLSASDDRAGTAGKCPKCGTEFVVPELEPEEVAHDAEPVAGEPMPESIEIEPVESDQLFFFLCPNGHKLNGPPTLKGRPGQCPHCGAKFRIPPDEDDVDSQQDGQDDPIPVGAIVEDGGEDADPVEEVEIIEEFATAAPPPVCGHALGDLLMQLWEQAGDGRTVELTMKDKSTVSAGFFSASLSSTQYGVFAIHEDGDNSVLVVSWDDVARFRIRNVTGLSQRTFR